MKITRFLNHVSSEKFASKYAKAIVLGYGLLILAMPAEAQSLRSGLESFFNTIYAVVGVVGGIACLLTMLNWAGGGIVGNDPKKYFIYAFLGTCGAFGVVGLIQFAKSMFGSSSGGISGV